MKNERVFILLNAISKFNYSSKNFFKSVEVDELLMKNERGFMLLSAIFLTLIVSITATILLNTNLKFRQRNSTLYFTAINLANEQFAILESGEKIEIPAEDLISLNGLSEDAEPINFDVDYELESENENFKKYKVTVKWTVNGKNQTFESVKTILSKKNN